MFIKFLTFLLIFFTLPLAAFSNEEVFENEKFEAGIIFQRGTNILEKNDTSKTEYYCDNKKDECKINLLFEALYDNSKLTESKLICETDFSFETDQENRCNPSYINIPEGQHKLDYKIIFKADENIFTQGSIVFHNEKDLEDLGESGESQGQEQEDSELSSSTDENVLQGQDQETIQNKEEPENGESNLDGESVLELPGIDLQIQSGADFGENNEIICPEQGEDICKINFTLGEIDEKEFVCKFDYGLGEITNQEEKCNPGYVDFPEGKFEMKVQVYEKNREENALEKVFTVNNEKNQTEEYYPLIPIDEEENEGKQQEYSEEEKNSSTSEEENLPLTGGDLESTLVIQSGADFSSESENEIVCPEEGTGICKINFLVEGADNCTFDFGLENETSYEQNCNPGYIDFPVGDTNMILTFGGETKKYTIKNSVVERDFRLQLTTQTPNYLLETDEQEVLTCDRSKEICKVNFDLRESFGGENASKFSCLHHFSFGETGEEKKCNPNTIEIPLGEHTFEFTITSRTTTKTKIIHISNEGYEKKSSTKSSSFTSKSTKKRKLPRNEIEVQSGLDEQLTCDKKECKVNFDYNDDDRDDIACKWYFGDAVFNEASKSKCNPGYVTFGPGEHTVTVKVYQKNMTENARFKTITFTNTYEKPPLESKIELQGKLAKYKKYFVNRVFCNGVKSCSLNFDGTNSSGEIEKYHWDFGNGEIFEGKNPKTVEFFPGEYEVKLTVSDKQDNKNITTFFVKVTEKEHTDEEIQAYIFELFPTMFQFKNTVVNWYNGLYLFENMKLFEQAREEKFEKLRLSLRKNKNSATVYGKAEPGAVVIISEKVDILFWKGLFVKNQYEVEADEKGKFAQKIVYDELGDFTVGAVQADEKLGDIDFPKEKYFSVTEVGENSQIDNQKEKNIFTPVVIDLELQGKIGKNKIVEGNNITCIGTCSINLKSNSTGSIASEHWDFGNGEKSEKKNPKSIKYEQFGNYTITYTVTDTNGEVFTEKFSMKFIKKPKKTRKKKLKKKKVGPVKLQIEVQGKIGKSKKLEPGKLTCYGTCKVNFDGRKSSGAYKQLIWDFGNGEIFRGENPKYVTYEKYGTYTVTLKAPGYDDKWYTQNFLVAFLEKQGINLEKNSSEKESRKEPEIIENMLVEKRQYTKLDIFYLSLIFSITMGGGGLSFWRIRKG